MQIIYSNYTSWKLVIHPFLVFWMMLWCKEVYSGGIINDPDTSIQYMFWNDITILTLKGHKECQYLSLCCFYVNRDGTMPFFPFFIPVLKPWVSVDSDTHWIFFLFKNIAGYILIHIYRQCILANLPKAWDWEVGGNQRIWKKCSRRWGIHEENITQVQDQTQAPGAVRWQCYINFSDVSGYIFFNRIALNSKYLLTLFFFFFTGSVPEYYIRFCTKRKISLKYPEHVKKVVLCTLHWFP